MYSSRNFTVFLVAGVLLLNALVAGVALLGAASSKREFQARARITTQNLSLLLERDLSSVFDRIDLTLNTVVDEAERQIKAGGISRTTFNDFLSHQQHRLPEIISLRVTDEGGAVRYGEGVPLASAVDVSDRGFFVRARSSVDPGVIVGKPVQARISAQWVVPVARRISRPDGRFAGIAYANLPASYFADKLASLSLEQRGLVALRYTDHFSLARHPESFEGGEAVGQLPISDQLRELLKSDPASVSYDAPSPTDGVERTYTYTRFQKYPLYVVVGVAQDDYLGEWKKLLVQTLLALAVFICMTTLFAWLLLRAWRRQLISDQALGESEERFRLLFKYSPIGLVLVNLDRKITDANEAFCALVGRGLEELRGGSFLDITHPESRETSRSNVNDLLENKISHYAIEKRYVHKDGHTVWASVLATAIRNPAGAVLYGLAIVQDITERREAERIRIEQLERQRDVLVREVHHRIKNNLQGVISLLEQLKLKQPDAADALEEAAGQIGAIAVVHGLHSQTLAPDVRPRQLIQAIVDSVSRLSHMPISCSANHDASSWEWRLNGRDSVSIALIVNELLYNAIKHTRASPEAQVTVDFESQPGAFTILVRNWPARLPERFDWSNGVGLGTGLTLISSLLPHQGAALQIRQRGDAVEARLQLSHPCVDIPPPPSS